MDYIFKKAFQKKQRPVITDSICFNATRLARRVNANAIITMTHSGYTAFKISSQRPRASIYVFSKNKKLLSSLSWFWE